MESRPLRLRRRERRGAARYRAREARPLMTPLNQTVVPLLTADRSNGRRAREMPLGAVAPRICAPTERRRLRNYSAATRKTVALARGTARAGHVSFRANIRIIAADGGHSDCEYSVDARAPAASLASCFGSLCEVSNK